jgi:hypothetical protein
MSIYSVAVVFDQTTKKYTVIEPAGLMVETASLDEIVSALPGLAQAAYNLPAGSAEGLELLVKIPPDPAATGPSGPTGTTGTTGTTGPTGTGLF